MKCSMMFIRRQAVGTQIIIAGVFRRKGDGEPNQL